MDTQMNSETQPEQKAAQEEPTPPDIQAVDIKQAPAPAQPAAPPPAQEPFFFYEDGNDDPESALSAPYTPPFQLSSAMPVVNAAQGTGGGQAVSPQPPPQVKSRRFSFLRIGVVAAIIVVALGLGMTVFAAPAQPLTTTGGTPHGGAPTAIVAQNSPITAPTAKPQPRPTARPTLPPPGMMQGGGWISPQLPDGWANAGLHTADAIQAERTAVIFTDREEALDFRNVGSRGQHGGTMTGAFFILSSAAQNRFRQNDVRVINNTLFDHIQQTQLVQAAINPIPTLVKFQAQGQANLAWVTVSYQLFSSQLDPNTPQNRREGLEMDPATNQPRTHSMSVLLVRVKPQTQGANAPAGGTGWLVSNYGLDQPNAAPVDFAQPA